MATEFKLPELGENIKSAQVVKVLVKAGDTVAADQPVLELETNKATLELPCPSGGIVEEVKVREGDEIEVGAVILTLGAQGEPKPASRAPEPRAVSEAALETKPARPVRTEPVGSAPPPPAPPPVGAAGVAAAPSVRRFAREMGMDIARVVGTGPHGRVSVDDVKTHARGQSEAASAKPAAGGGELPPLPNFAHWGEVERQPMSHIRRMTAEHLTLCWTQIAHVTQFDTADITKLEALRQRFAKKAEDLGGKLTMAVMVVKAAAAALKIFPKFNASIDMAQREIILKKYVHIGIAVNTERGLLVPVLRDVDRKNMVQIAVEVSRLAEKTRQGKVTVEDLQGGTFTVTNLGSIGGTHFTPIVNWPEVAILGMGRAYTEAGLVNGVWQPRTVLPLSLAYDHRLIDGAEGAKFLRWIVEAIEEPFILSLEG